MLPTTARVARVASVALPQVERADVVVQVAPAAQSQAAQLGSVVRSRAAQVGLAARSRAAWAVRLVQVACSRAAPVDVVALAVSAAAARAAPP
jgi:hypothetical protein